MGVWKGVGRVWEGRGVMGSGRGIGARREVWGVEEMDGPWVRGSCGE